MNKKFFLLGILMVLIAIEFVISQIMNSRLHESMLQIENIRRQHIRIQREAEESTHRLESIINRLSNSSLPRK